MGKGATEIGSCLFRQLLTAEVGQARLRCAVPTGARPFGGGWARFALSLSKSAKCADMAGTRSPIWAFLFAPGVRCRFAKV